MIQRKVIIYKKKVILKKDNNFFNLHKETFKT